MLTLVGVGSVVYLMKSDVRHGGAMLKRNMRTIKNWLEEESATAASKCVTRARLLVANGLTRSVRPKHIEEAAKQRLKDPPPS